MKVVKGGISREIDEKNLQEYIEKGYAPAEEKPKDKKPAEKPKE